MRGSKRRCFTLKYAVSLAVHAEAVEFASKKLDAKRGRELIRVKFKLLVRSCCQKEINRRWDLGLR